MILVGASFGLQTLLSILCLYFLAKNISVELFGQVTFSLLLTNVIALLDGMKVILVFELNKENLINHKRILNSAFLINVFISASVGVLGMLYFYVFSKKNTSNFADLLILCTWVLYFYSSFYCAVLDSRGRYVLTQVCRSVIWSGIYVSICFLSFKTERLEFYNLTLLVGALGTLVFFRLSTGNLEIFKGKNYSFITIKRLLRSSIDQVAFQLAAVLIASYDRVALNLAKNYYGLGLYSGSYELATKANAGPRLLTQYFYPKICQNKENYKIEYYRSVANQIVICSASITFILVIYSKDFIRLFLGESYDSAATAFSVILLAFPFVIQGYFYNTYLNISGDFKTQRIIYLLYLPVLAIFGLILFFNPNITLAAVFYFLLRSCDIATIIVSNKNKREVFAWVFSYLIFIGLITIVIFGFDWLPYFFAFLSIANVFIVMRNYLKF